ncbi:twin-arginine translocase subunit TatB [Halomonas sp. FME1]|uniref:Sec-independent protein translocase protein TatB n=1 Tax=Halomonas casei TaxID=2742613 RepID=A0ABR9F3P4_9GAMM|nr:MULTISPECIES: Sec-independent protein translocase protein TatB [Halomonas]MBE0401097.1 twin-arginine translocase subunit TatB [Halomonas casei]PCC21656.1 twin-arginine translocase subunit TatB [Halomonas sp. JB37]
MLDIGFLELMLIGVVALLVLGPERLPRAARTTGLWIGRIKRTVSGMQREISAQLEAEELRQKLNDQQKKLNDSLQKAKLDVESIVDKPTTTQAKPASAATPRGTLQPETPQSEIQQRAVQASSHLDDALETVREEAPASSPAPPPAASSVKTDATEAERAAFNKDSNHQ